MKRGACGKVILRSRQAAKRHLAYHVSLGRNSRRIYYCKRCEAYHLTSSA